MEEVRHDGSIPETWGDVSILGTCESHTEAIIGVRFGDADAETWKSEGMDNLLPLWEEMKRGNHGHHCHYQRKHFSSFVPLVDGMTVKESQITLAALIQLMAKKMDKPISYIKVWG